MHAEKDSEPADQTTYPGETPSDADLDVEGPNESAPGHEPRPVEGDEEPTNQGSSPS